MKPRVYVTCQVPEESIVMLQPECEVEIWEGDLPGREALRKMKSSAVLVNASRGGVIDRQALYEALRDGEIAYAALDVTEPEPIPEDDPLFEAIELYRGALHRQCQHSGPHQDGRHGCREPAGRLARRTITQLRESRSASMKLVTADLPILPETRNQDHASSVSKKVDKTVVAVIHWGYLIIEYLPDDVDERELHRWSRRRGKLVGLTIPQATLSGKRIARRRPSGEPAVCRTEGATPRHSAFVDGVNLSGPGQSSGHVVSCPFYVG